MNYERGSILIGDDDSVVAYLSDRPQEGTIDLGGGGGGGGDLPDWVILDDGQEELRVTQRLRVGGANGDSESQAFLWGGNDAGLAQLLLQNAAFTRQVVLQASDNDDSRLLEMTGLSTDSLDFIHVANENGALLAVSPTGAVTISPSEDVTGLTVDSSVTINNPNGEIALQVGGGNVIGVQDLTAATLSTDWLTTEFTGGRGKMTVWAEDLGFYEATPVPKPTGVAVSAAGIHAALVTLGLIAA